MKGTADGPGASWGLCWNWSPLPPCRSPVFKEDHPSWPDYWNCLCVQETPAHCSLLGVPGWFQL